MLTTLEENLKMVRENRRELTEEVVPQEQETTATEEAPVYNNTTEEDSYDFDTDTFLDNIE